MADLDFRSIPSTRVNACPTGLRVAGLVLFAAFAVCVVGCGSSEDPSFSPKAKAPAATQPDMGAEKPMAKAPQPGYSKGSLPEDFPKDVPVYPGAKPGDSLAIPGGAAVAIFSSDASTESVLAFYEKELAGQGWNVQGTREGSVSANKGARTVTVAVERRGSGTEIAVGVTGG